MTVSALRKSLQRTSTSSPPVFSRLPPLFLPLLSNKEAATSAAGIQRRSLGKAALEGKEGVLALTHRHATVLLPYHDNGGGEKEGEVHRMKERAAREPLGGLLVGALLVNLAKHRADTCQRLVAKGLTEVGLSSFPFSTHAPSSSALNPSRHFYSLS